MRTTFASILVLLLGLGVFGCAADTDIDNVVIESEIRFPFVPGAEGTVNDEDPGDQGENPCLCGDDYDCLSRWVIDAFDCGVCLTLSCGGAPGATICSPVCPPNGIHSFAKDAKGSVNTHEYFTCSADRCTSDSGADGVWQ